eukprot:TRINITY_DN31767_c2_g1_i3.p1 TRINITY_DN31767_c2_g1~~TRINITY_DN31767_c2_g1_i3.p1  ORF type:complete len:361 (-),score=56.38 TRINITY_DN31767_c2_g1_i3:573-1655(-)
MEMPIAVCLSVDYNSKRGMTLLPGDWPRLSRLASSSLPWDILFSLALVDAAMDQGHGFWKDYVLFLPAPQTLCLPMCWPEYLLKQLQDDQVKEGAILQQKRLRDILHYEALTTQRQADGDLPSLFEWAFACVRSRAFKLKDDYYAYIPFLDMANHSPEPNANYQYNQNGFVELVAVKDIKAKEEVTISYTGKYGESNRKLLQKYGFVVEQGNFADRIEFKLDGIQFSGAKLSLLRFQKYLGDFIFQDAMNGTNLYMFAAIRSFPVGDDPDADLPITKEEINFAKELQNQIIDDLLMCSTSIEEDRAILEELKKQSSVPDVRVRAALRYRMERKMLLGAAKSLIDLYIKKGQRELEEQNQP